MSGDEFACRITDLDYLAAFAPEQPAAVEVGQEWMRVSDGATLPVKRVDGDRVDLGGSSLTIGVYERLLREEWVCVSKRPTT